MEQLNKHSDPETDGYYMILGKLHFWGSEYGFFLHLLQYIYQL